MFQFLLTSATLESLAPSAQLFLYVWGNDANNFTNLDANVLTSWTSIDSGTSHSVAIRSDGLLYAWGLNSVGQIGDGTIINKLSPVQIGSSSWTAVSAGASHTMALRNDGKLFGWGLNTSGQLGVNSSQSWVQISAGTGHVLAINSLGSLFAWGLGTTGQLGDGTAVSKSSPIQIGLSSWTAVAAGTSHSAAIRADGTLFAWGLNSSGQLGDGTTVNKSSPVQIGSSSWTAISSEGAHNLAVRSGGTLFAWGLNSTGQIGDSTTVNKSSPVQIGSSSWTAVSAGLSHSTAISNTNTLYAWGGAASGQLGDATTVNKSSPVQIGSSSWTAVAAGGSHTAAIRSDGILFTWGLNSSGQLGYTGSQQSWVAISAAPGEVSAGHTLAIRSDGQLWAWGLNSVGQLGDNTTVNKSSPVLISTSSWVMVSAGSSHSTAVRSGGTLFSWGLNSSGQLGDGTTVNKSSPVVLASTPVTYNTMSWSLVDAGTQNTAAIRSDGMLFTWGLGTSAQLGYVTDVYSWTQVSAGVTHAAAIRSDGMLFTWGLNSSGQLGDGTTINRSSPVQIGSSSWTAVSAGNAFVAAIRSGGTLFTWGLNSSGQLGDSTTVNKSSPVLLAATFASSSWTAVSAGGTHVAAIRSGGTVFTWGLGTSGQLGDGSTISKSSPVLLASSAVTYNTSSWTAVSAGGLHTMAIRSGNTLFTWGLNSSGQLGDGTTVLKNSPTQIGSQSWIAIAAGHTHSVAINSANTLHTWGRGNEGQLGDSTTVSKSSPVQIGSSSWTAISAGLTHTLGTVNNGNLYAWGLNSSAQLGDGTTVNRSSPVLVSLPTDSYSVVTGGGVNSFGLRGNLLYGWGAGTVGSIGDTTTINKSNSALIGNNPIVATQSTPVQVGMSSWTQVSMGGSHTVAIRSGGTLFAWGAAANGQLGYVTPVNSWIQISVGSSHTMAIRNDGILFTWGLGTSGQLGDSTLVSKSSPVQIGSSSWTAVAAGGLHSVAIRSGGTLFTWGLNSAGQMGDSTVVNKSSPVQIGTDSWTAVSAGASHSAAIRSDNVLFAWGLNSTGQVGDGTTINKISPRIVDLPDVNTLSLLFPGAAQVSIATTEPTSFVIGAGQFTYEAWVYRTSSTFQTLFTDAGATATVLQVFFNASNTAELWVSASQLTGNFGSVPVNQWHHIIVQRDSSNNLQAYVNGVRGYNTVRTDSFTNSGIRIGGRGGDYLIGYISNFRYVTGSALYSGTPITVPTSPLTAIANTQLLIAQSKIYIDNSVNNSYVTTDNLISISTVNPFNANTEPGKFSSVTAGTAHTMAITTNGNLQAWGSGADSRLGYAAQQQWLQVSHGVSHTVAIRNDGILFAWGLNSVGQLGDGTTVNKSSPIQIGSSSWTAVTAGASYTMAIRSGGTLFAWGLNSSGQLGDGTTINRSVVTQIGSASWIAISTEGSHSIGLTNTNTLYAWGLNSSGQLGDSTTVNKSSPVQIGSSSWTAISAGTTHTAAIASGGTLFTWGRGIEGQLGIVTQAYSWTQISSGSTHTLAIRNDGLLFAWGLGTSGQLGDGTAVTKSSPVQIGSSSWTAVSAGTNYSMAIRSGGTLFTWGLGNSGQLGDGTLTSKSSPVQIGSSSWTAVSSDLSHSVALRSDGYLYAWGLNSSYQIGDSTSTNRSSPTLLGMNSTTNISAYFSGAADNYVTGPYKIINYNATTFTIDGWVYLIDAATDRYIIGEMSATTLSRNLSVSINTSRQLVFYWREPNFTTRTCTTTAAFTLNTWTYFAVVVNNAAISIYIGSTTASGLTGTTTMNFRSANQTFTVGQFNTGNNFYGYLNNLRVSSVARSVASLPTAAFTVDSNTTLLIFRNPYFVDNGSNQRLTVTGTVLTTELLPFAGTTTAQTFSSVSAGASHIMAISTDNKIFAVGRGDEGQLGYVSETLSWTQLASGYHHTMAIRSDGLLFTWGENAYGVLGDQTGTNKSSPVQIGSSSWTAVAAGQYHSLAIRSGGTLFAWGRGHNGQLGTGNFTASNSSPVQIGTKSWTAISASMNFSLGIDSNNVLYSWGVNDRGYLGNNDPGQDYRPVPGPVGMNTTTIASVRFYSDHSSYLRVAQSPKFDFETNPFTIEGWFYTNNYSNYTGWVNFFGIGAFGGYTHKLNLFDSDGTGQLRLDINGTILLTTSAVKTTLTDQWAHIALVREGTGTNQTKVYVNGTLQGSVTVAQNLLFKGSNFIIGNNGELYSNSLNGWVSNFRVVNGTAVYTGNFTPSTSALTSVTNTVLLTCQSETLKDNGPFSFDIETVQHAHVDTVTPFAGTITYTNYTKVESGDNHVMAIDSSGSLYTWGYGFYGQLGLAANATTQYSWKSIASGAGHTLAIRSDNKLFAWGRGSEGQIGDGRTLNNRSSPVQIGTNSWIAVAAGLYHSVGIKADNTLWTWGYNNNGQLGTRQLTNYDTPQQIGLERPVSISWTQIAAGAYHTAAITSTNRLYAWGLNDNGQLGDRTTNNRSIPAAIGMNTTANASVYFDGTSYLNLSSFYIPDWPSDINLSGSGVDFQIEAWIYVTEGDYVRGIICHRNAGEADGWDLNLAADNTLHLSANIIGVGWSDWQLHPTPIQSGVWTHIALVKTANDYYRAYINGVNLTSLNYTGGLSYLDTPGTVRYFGIGVMGTPYFSGVENPFRGYISSVRINKGGDIYTANFTPSTSTLTAGTYTKLLACQSEKLVDVVTGLPVYTSPTPLPIVSDFAPYTATATFQEFANVSLGHSHTAAIGTNNKLYTWGRTNEGQTGSLANAPPPYIGLDGAEDPRWAIVAGESNYAYGIRTDGLLYAWGDNTYGQLGDGTTVNKSSPVQIGTDSWVAISAGNSGSAIAIRTDGKLFAWGRGDTGGGVGALVSDTHSWKQVSVGNSQVVAIRSDGLLFTWGAGANSYTSFLGAVSNPKATFSPNQIGYSSWTMVSSGDNHFLAIRKDGTLFTWGRNDLGQVGDGTTVTKSSPVAISGDKWTWVGAGRQFSNAIRSDGRLFTWGQNIGGQLGDGTTVNKSSPVQIGTSSWTMVKGGGSHTVAIRSDGILFTWGYNNFGQLGDSSTVSRSSPVQIAGVEANSSWSSITAADHSVLGITGGKLFAWGYNNFGQLGDGTGTGKSSPIQIGALTDWYDVEANVFHVMALRTNGALYSWGRGLYGIIGDGTTVTKSSPVQIGADGDWWVTGLKTGLGPGIGTAAGIKANGTLWTWGGGSGDGSGLGNVSGSTNNYSSPVIVGGQSHISTVRNKYEPFQLGTDSWTVVAAGYSHTMAIRADGKLFTWGFNASGQLGDGTTVNKSAMTQIGSDSWVMVTAGGDHSLAIKKGVSPNPDYYGTLWAWGKNDVGQLGIGLTGTANNRNSPVQIGTSVWAAISAGRSHTAGIKDSLSVWAWGLNASGQLGDSTTTNRNSPVISGILETIAQVEAGSSHTAALATSGNFYTWGLGASGQLWSGATSNVNSPTSRKSGIGYGRDSFAPIMGGTDASNYLNDRLQIAAGPNNTWAIDFNGQYIWSAGLGTSGQLGDGTAVSKSSPVAVATLWVPDTSPRLLGNSSWTAVSAGRTHTAAIRNNGMLFTWGGNDYGQLGLGDTVTRLSPTQLGSSSWTAVASGEFMTVAIRSGGTLFTWGRGTEGQIGDGAATTRSSPVQVGSASWIAIAAGEGEYYAAGIAADNYLYTWGYNNQGQLGLINTTNYSSPVQVGGQFDTEDKYTPVKVGTSSWTAIAAGQYHSLAIRSGGTLFTWGYNNVGQLGDGTAVNKSSPVQIGSSSWTAVSAGESHSVAIRSGGTLFAWGRASEGQLGNLSLTALSSPVQVGTSTSWTAVSGGRYHTAGINDNNIAVWGWNNYGQIGDNTTVNKSSPVLLGGIAFAYTQSIPVQINSSSWTAVSAGGTHTAAIRSDSTLWTWGFNSSGQLGDGTTIVRSSPVQIGSSSWTAVSAGASHTLGISANIVYTWGLGTSGQLGDGTAVTKSSPVQIGTSSWTAISAGDNHNIVLRNDGILYAWGLNSSGQLGDSTNVNRSSPVQIGGNADFYSRSSPVQVNSQSWVAVAAGGAHTLAIGNTGTLFTWGLGTSGQLGDATTVTKGSPVQIGSSSWTAVAAGITHSLAINTNNILYAWGLGTSGQLGDGTTVTKSSPVQIGSSSWTAISAGTTATLAIASNNMLWDWGLNTIGELGDGTTVNKSSPVLLGLNSTDNRSLPVPVGTGISWSVASAGERHSAAINDTGTLYAWGLNDTGQLGDSTTINKTSPVQIGSSSWTAVAAGTSYTMAIRSDGTLFTWGLGSSGELGDGTTVAKSSPVQIGSQSWTAISTDGNFSGGISANLLYIWGVNGSGQIGDNSTINKSSPQLIGNNGITVIQSSPVQLGTSSWTAVAAGGFHTVAIRSGGTLFTWGLNASGQVGDNSTIDKSSPVQLGTMSWSVVAAGLSNSAAIRSDNRLFMWGLNASGQLGDNTNTNRSSPLVIGGGAYSFENISWTSVSIGKDHAAAITPETGGAFIWGLNTSGQLGDATTVSKFVPVVVINSGITATQSSPVQIGTGSWSAIAAGPTHTMAVSSAGGLFTWGLNTSGQLGENSNQLRYIPFRIGNSTWANVSTGDAFSVAISANASVYVWGLGTSGQLGDGTVTSKSVPTVVLTGDTVNRSSPVQIGASSWTAVSAGSAHTLAIRSDNLLFAWGLNNVGQVGDGTATTRSQPQQIGFSSWTAVSAGASHSVALDITNRMYTWGLGTSGQLGDGTATSKSSPVAIGSSSWTAISAGGAHTSAIRSGGTLFTWGLAASGQLGDSTTVNKSSPVQIGSSSWTAVAAGDSHTVAIAGNYALYAWGLNSTYQVGDGTTVNKSSPVLISSANNAVSWTTITAGTGHSMAISANNHIWTWGTDNVGQLGDIS